MIKINEKYEPLYNESSRIYIITGDRGSSKSFTVADYLCRKSFSKKQVIYFTRYTMESAQDSVIPEFSEKIERLNALSFFSQNKTDISNKYSGSLIKFRGVKPSKGSQTAKLKALTGATVWVIDEAEEFTDEESFDKLNKSLRGKNEDGTDKKFIIIFILNPTYRQHFIYERFFKSKGIDENWNGIKDNVCYIHVTWEDNRNNLDEDFIREAEDLRDTNLGKYKKVYCTGWLDPDAGLVFKYGQDWVYYYNEPENWDSEYYGMDLGYVHPTACIRIRTDDKNKIAYCKQLVHQPGLLNNPLSVLLKPQVGENWIVTDSEDPKTIVSLRTEYGINTISAVKGQDSVRAGLRRMKGWKIKLWFEDKETIKDFFNYRYIDGKGLIEEPLKENDDSCDAIRYIFLKFRL
jgi:phage terminase large subunit